MPPKKKRKSSVGPGIASTYLGEEYASQSENQPVLVGHVLYSYVNSSNRSIANVQKELEHKYKISTQKYAVTKVVSTFQKMKKLTDNEQFSLFKRFCEGPFEVLMSTQRGIEIKCGEKSNQPGENDILQGAEVTGKRKAAASEKQPCIRCSKFMDALDTERKLRENMRKRFRTENSVLRRKLQILRVLNQKIKRQKKRIEAMKEYTAKAESERNEKLKIEIAVLQQKVTAMEKNRARRKQYSIKSQKIQDERNEREKDDMLKESERIIRDQSDKLCKAEIAIDVLGEELASLKDSSTIPAHSGKKQFNMNTRMMVYDAIINQVPTMNIPLLMQSFSRRLGAALDHVPHRTTVEQMAKELGVISQLQCAEALLANSNVTIAFDATTQEGVHINALVITTETKTLVCAIDELPGGCAKDYANHIIESIADLAKLYVQINANAAFQETRCKMISNVKNTMTDRAAANHAAIRLINEHWGKSLNDLHCNLHPLDSISTCCRVALKSEEKEHTSLYGKDCVAGKIVVQINKLRYKDGKGDPRGFVIFLESNNLPRGLLPRYRGNRLHIVFHICGLLIEHYETFLLFFQHGTSCGGLRKAIYKDFCLGVVQREMIVLGLIGKYLTGPWMRKFYVTRENQTIDVVGAIEIIKEVNARIKEQAFDAESFLDRQTDFFNEKVDGDTTLAELKHRGRTNFDRSFVKMIEASLKAVSDVVERQYRKYYDDEVLPELLEEEAKSCRLNNIDCEEIMGMFSSAKNRAPNASLSYLSAKLRSKKNNTVLYLDNMDEKLKEDLIEKIVPIASKSRDKIRLRRKEIQSQIADRDARKRQKLVMKDKKKVEKILRRIENVDEIDKEFPELERNISQDLRELLSGNSVGKDIFHVWQEESGEKKSFMGRIEKVKARNVCKVGYWDVKEETHEDAVDYDISLYALGADLINENLFFIN